MRFGLKTIAVKNLISMKMGLNKKLKVIRERRSSIEDSSISYSQFLLQIMGIDDKVHHEIPEDNINWVVKARAIFKEATEQYRRVMEIKPKKIQDKIKSIIDLNSGGEWSIFEVIEITTNCMIKNKQLLNSFIPKIQPIQTDNEIDSTKFLLTFSLMKICHKIGKIPKIN